ncbi:MAG: alpha/beta fold hydrolase [Opitutales bacterium]
MSESLYFEEYGKPGSPILIFLHGLLGSSRNWRSVAKALADQYHIFALDLPEHGNSPHRSSTSLVEMNDQVTQWIDHHLKEEYVLCGHSLGGKVAMAHACAQPKHMKGLVVVDIAPRDYPPEHHLPTLEAMLSLDLNNLESRKDADDQLSARIPNWAFRQFLLTNLKEDGGAWKWQSNLPTLHSSMPSLSINPLSENDSYAGPTLFVRGGKSGYLRSEHFPLIMDFFPAAKIETIPEAGHDVHVEDRAGFVQQLTQFLRSI